MQGTSLERARFSQSAANSGLPNISEVVDVSVFTFYLAFSGEHVSARCLKALLFPRSYI
jgi:hypothetical protein